MKANGSDFRDIGDVCIHFDSGSPLMLQKHARLAVLVAEHGQPLTCRRQAPPDAWRATWGERDRNGVPLNATFAADFRSNVGDMGPRQVVLIKVTAAAIVARYFRDRALRSRGRIRQRIYRAAWRYFRDRAPR